MKVLVTGASGYLGRHVVRCLLRTGHTVTILGRHRPSDLPDVDFVALDLLEHTEARPQLEQADATHLLHLAWVTEYQTYRSSPLNFRWVDASLRLVEAFCASGGRHVVVAGTCAEYDWTHGYLREGVTPYAPASTYGIAKDATRRLLGALCGSHGASLGWGHVFFPFGPGEAAQRMVPRLIDVFEGSAPAFGINAGAYRGMLYVPDAARAFVSLLECGLSGNFNICSGQPVLLADVVRELARLCGADARTVLDLASHRPDDPALLVGENLGLRGTGWKPVWTLEQGLADMVRNRREFDTRTLS